MPKNCVNVCVSVYFCIGRYLWCYMLFVGWAIWSGSQVNCRGIYVCSDICVLSHWPWT